MKIVIHVKTDISFDQSLNSLVKTTLDEVLSLM